MIRNDLIDAVVSGRLVTLYVAPGAGSRSRGPPLNGPRVILRTLAINLTLTITTPDRSLIGGGRRLLE